MRKCSRKKIVDERVTNSYLLCLTIMQNDALSPFYVPGFSAGAGFVFFFLSSYRTDNFTFCMLQYYFSLVWHSGVQNPPYVLLCCL